MEVTRTNFKDVLATLPDVFKNADFITFDTEFTGLRIKEQKPYSYYDSLECVYEKNKLKAEKFMAIQYGIVAFKYDQKRDVYFHSAYNFYVYPSGLSQNVNFLSEASSLEFLVGHGFDFNKLFKDGIPYLTDEELEHLLNKLKEKQKDSEKELHKGDLKIPQEHQDTIKEVHTKIRNSLKKKEGSLEIEKHNSFVRRLIYQSVQEKYPDSVFLETLADERMRIWVGLTKEEIEQKYNLKFEEEKQTVLDNYGFTKVIKLITESRKLFIGHNMFKDILFTIRQFVQPLPDSYKELKQLAHFAFPRLVDTKYMATMNEFKTIKDSALWNLAKHFKDNNSIPVVEVAEAQGGCGYSGQEEDKCHEASYDAYLTGLCFLAMADHIGLKYISGLRTHLMYKDLNPVMATLPGYFSIMSLWFVANEEQLPPVQGDGELAHIRGKLNKTNIHKVLSNSPLLEPALNKMCVPRLHDIPYINLGGPDLVPNRDSVFHIQFPSTWRRDDILKLFKCHVSGFVSVSWIDDTSAYVCVKKDQINKVLTAMPKVTKDYSLQTYKQHVQNIEAMRANGEKRTQGEDVGEVVQRPVKKVCSFETPTFD